MRRIAEIAGLFMIVMGLLWVGQGLGLIHWPPDSFMLDRRPWALRGALLAAAGAVTFALARRRRG